MLQLVLSTLTVKPDTQSLHSAVSEASFRIDSQRGTSYCTRHQHKGQLLPKRQAEIKSVFQVAHSSAMPARCDSDGSEDSKQKTTHSKSCRVPIRSQRRGERHAHVSARCKHAHQTPMLQSISPTCAGRSAESAAGTARRGSCRSRSSETRCRATARYHGAAATVVDHVSRR